MSKKFKVNDIHVHIGASNGVYRKLPIEDLIGFMKKYEINQLAATPFEIETVLDNERILKIAKEHKTIHCLYWIQKNRINEDLKILEKELHDGLIGVKFHGAFEEKSVIDEVYSPIMKELNDKKGIILIHCGRFKEGYPESNTSFEHGLTLAKKYSKIKIVLAHMGGNDTSVVKRAVMAAKDISNVYFDTSGISTPFRIEFAVKKIGPDRIIFGSDYPWCSYLGNYYNVEDSLLEDNDKEKIFFENFLKLIC